MLTKPVVLGAVISAIVTVNTALISIVTAYLQRDTESAKRSIQASLDRSKFEMEMLFRAMQVGDSGQAAKNLRFLANVGLLRSDVTQRILTMPDDVFRAVPPPSPPSK